MFLDFKESDETYTLREPRCTFESLSRHLRYLVASIPNFHQIQIQIQNSKNLYCFPYSIEAYNKQVRFKIQ